MDALAYSVKLLKAILEHPKNIELYTPYYEMWYETLVPVFGDIQVKALKLAEPILKTLHTDKTPAHGSLLCYFPRVEGEFLYRDVIHMSVANHGKNFYDILLNRDIVGILKWEQLHTKDGWINTSDITMPLRKHAVMFRTGKVNMSYPQTLAFIELLQKKFRNYNLFTHNCHDAALALEQYLTSGFVKESWRGPLEKRILTNFVNHTSEITSTTQAKLLSDLMFLKD